MTAFARSMLRRPQTPLSRRNSEQTLSARRESEMSLLFPPPPLGKVLQYFLVLPTSILDLICVYLDANDVKNLSLTCFGILDKIELTRELAPKIRVLNVKPNHQIHPSSRILPDSLVETTTPQLGRPYLIPEQDIPPEYFQLTRAAYHNAYRTQRTGTPTTVQAWICPHLGCTAVEASWLRNQHKICEGRVRDTIPAMCPFPKCSLWARHALVESSDEESVFELSSTIKVCRFRCQDLSSARSVLTNRNNKIIFKRAMRQLHLPLCSHLMMSDEEVYSTFESDNVTVLDAHVNTAHTTTLTRLAGDIDRHGCNDCPSVGTYTTWGFTSRLVSEANGNWLDVEMILCRPLYTNESVGSLRGIHWRHHSTRFPQAPEFVECWWKWAEVVAEAGFDWRARLPAQFLLRSHSNLTAFPSRPPRYSDLEMTQVLPEKAKLASFARRRPRQIFGIA